MPSQPETVEDYHARIRAELGEDGRLELPEDGIPFWEIFPFEAEGLRLKPIAPLADTEPSRIGDDPETCYCLDPAAGDSWPVLWEDDAWRVKLQAPSGSPLGCVAEPKAHHDLADLPDDLATGMGVLMVRLAAAIEALPSVGRCHVQKWGDGGAHLHVFFLARPARMPQMRGTCMALWDDFLPPVPEEVQRENARFVAEQLVSTAGGSSPLL